MPPASAMAIRSSTVTGYIENATAALPRVDGLLERLGAARAADEIDALVGADVADAETGSSTLRCSRATSSAARARVVGRRRAAEVDRVPAAVEVHRDLALPLRRRGAVGVTGTRVAQRPRETAPACGRRDP